MRACLAARDTSSPIRITVGTGHRSKYIEGLPRDVITIICFVGDMKLASRNSDECQVTPVIHVLQYPGCVPKPIPSFACIGRCSSYLQVRIQLLKSFDLRGEIKWSENPWKACRSAGQSASPLPKLTIFNVIVDRWSGKISFVCFFQVSGSKIWQMERSCMCCQESGEREAAVSLFCPKAKPGERKFRKVKVQHKRIIRKRW